jgi:hypothetical protein
MSFLPYVSGVKTLNAHFDGKHIVLDEPVHLKPDTKVRVIVSDSGEEAEIGEASSRMSEAAFKKIWDNALDADYDKP